MISRFGSIGILPSGYLVERRGLLCNPSDDADAEIGTRESPPFTAQFRRVREGAAHILAHLAPIVIANLRGARHNAVLVAVQLNEPYDVDCIHMPLPIQARRAIQIHASSSGKSPFL